MIQSIWATGATDRLHAVDAFVKRGDEDEDEEEDERDEDEDEESEDEGDGYSE